ncbi:hypothetical protein [Actinacidiphila sp. ITFR-21]|uniref:hypothetical protein n=1 Tax=Actinacidiphila sp. ITFR-21 TaxID=3075199 RepID=UPI00288C3BB5|nr:hypothetical protein [Streptomyces sp. ITFR-21]WNI16823.1 hypothetical protein RLT57_15730 [Streptomyces sp. ITFR-21]
MGRHKRQAAAGPDGLFRLAAARRAGVVAVMAAGVLIGCGSLQPVSAATQCCGCDGQEEDEPPPPSHGSNHGLLIIDNSNADSWLEVDRTLNTLVDSKGTAGSDHDGDGGDVDVTREPPTPGQAAPPEGPQGSEGDD